MHSNFTRQNNVSYRPFIHKNSEPKDNLIIVLHHIRSLAQEHLHSLYPSFLSETNYSRLIFRVQSFSSRLSFIPKTPT